MLNTWVVWLHKSNEDMKYRQFFDDPNAKYKGFICMFMLKEFPYLFIWDFFTQNYICFEGVYVHESATVTGEQGVKLNLVGNNTRCVFILKTVDNC